MTTGKVEADRIRLEARDAQMCASEARYRTLFEAMGSGFCIVEVDLGAPGRPIDYRVIEANPSFYEQTGFPGAILGRWLRAAAPALEEHWYEIYGGVARTGEPARFEAGSEALGRWFEVYAFRTGLPEQHQVAILFQDISVRRRADAVLRRSEERQAFLVRLNDTLRPLSDPEEIRLAAARVIGEHLNASRVAYAEDRADGTYAIWPNYVNGAADVQGVHRYDDYGPNIRAELQAGRTRVQGDIANDPDLTEAQKRGLAAFGVAASLNVPLVKHGRLVAFLGVNFPTAHEFTADEIELVQAVVERTWEAVERAQVSAALRESEARFRNMADHSPVMMWVTDEHGQCTYLNPLWYQFTGQSTAEALGLGWLDAIHAEDHDRTEHEFLDALKREASFRMEYRLRRFDGALRWVIDAASPRFDPSRRFVGYIGSVVDVTDRWEAEEALRQASRQKDEFLAMLAHELRNPMAPIRNAAELLSRTLPADSPLAPVSGMLRRQAQQLARLVDDLLDVSRITQGRIELRLERLDLNSAIGQALETVEPLLQERRHTLRIQTSALRLWVDADPERMVQVLSNILTNAVKYTEPGGQIHVLSHASADRAVVAIADSGIGISEEMLPRVFDLFVQSDRALDRSQGGLGIGLCVVKRLVEMHHGTVTATSGGLGTGSTFEIRLPLQASPAQDAASAAAPRAPSRRVLIVDDNADAAQSLAMVLSVEGHTADFVTQPRLAFERAMQMRPELVLLDIGMPDMDGFEVVHRLRAMPELAHTTIVAVTGYGRYEDRQMSAAAGFDAHLVKPVEFDALARVLASCRAPS